MDDQRPGFGCQWREKFPRLESAGYDNHHRQSQGYHQSQDISAFFNLRSWFGVSSGRVSTAGTLWDCRAGNGAKVGGVLPCFGVGGINTCVFNAAMVESSLPTRSRTATNTTRGLTLQIVVLGNLRARTPSKMCSKNLQVESDSGSWARLLSFPSHSHPLPAESDRSEDSENDNHGIDRVAVTLL
jgi:hypothetical protein